MDLIMRTPRAAPIHSATITMSVSVRRPQLRRRLPAIADVLGEAPSINFRVPGAQPCAGVVRPVLKHGWSPRVGRLDSRMGPAGGSPDLFVTWSNIAGPLFGNTIATLQITDRDAIGDLEQPDAQATLRR